MFTQSYDSAITFVAEMAPTLPTFLPRGRSNDFFVWAEQMSSVLAHIYLRDESSVLEDLVDQVKELQMDESDDDSDD